MNTPQGCIASSVFRLYVCGMAVLLWYFGFHEERSMNWLVAATDQGFYVLWLMLFFGVIGLLDIVLNDYAGVLRRRPLFSLARTHRHFGFAGLAFCHTCLVFIAVLQVASTGLALFSLWNAVFVVGFSLLDAHQRAQDFKKEAVCRPLPN
ncbi:hypothetical protein PQR05_29575 [Paraburkholderia sediminicola]|uniref:hypothetical protein n=1 Tax=Paraburkholderia sediminicola TaxID=458836 RepID=UPI0038B6C125